MKMFQVNQYGGRKVKNHGYYTTLKPYELLTLSQVQRCCLSGKVSRRHFNEIDVDKKKIYKATNGSTYMRR